MNMRFFLKYITNDLIGIHAYPRGNYDHYNHDLRLRGRVHVTLSLYSNASCNSASTTSSAFPTTPP